MKRTLVTFTEAVLLLTGTIAVAEKSPLQLTDLHRLQDLSEPQFSPDGQSVVYTVTSHNTDSDAQISDIWRVDWKSKQKQALTQTAFDSEWSPQYSPDGRHITFLSDRGDDETAQVWIMPAHGGEARVLTAFKGGVDDYQWSPDGKSLAIIARDAPEELAKDSRGKDKPPKPLEIDRYQFKEDGKDYLLNRYQHLYRFDLADNNVAALTRGAFNHWWPAWSPDSKRLVFVSKRGGDPDRHMNYDLYTIDRDGQNEKQLTTFIGNDNEPYWESRPQWSPSGQQIAYLRSGEDKWIYYAPWQLAVVDVNTGNESLAANIDRCFTHPQWSADGKAIYALIEHSRVTHLSRIDLKTAKVTALSSGSRFDYAFALRGDAIVLLSGDDKSPYQLRALQAGKETVLSDHNEWLASRYLQAQNDFSYAGKDGQTIDALVVKPLNYRVGEKYPTVVRLHGGPVYQFSHEFMFDWQWLAAQGFVVLGINPRGSSGRGFDFSRAIYADWGNVDASDVSAGVDALIATGVADPERLAIGGWSYGSILTNYVIARDHRFKAAFSGAGSSNMLGNYGLDQYTREYENELGTPWQNFEAYARVSFPFLRADTIKTPTLFLCAANDFNVPCNGAEQMYQALRSRNLPTKLIIYPGQNHGLTVPSYQQHRLQQYADWIKTYLK